MVAQLRPETETLPLLFPPDNPGFGPLGKTRRTSRFRQEEALDFGARVQHAIALYILTGMSRPEAARFLCMSEAYTKNLLWGRAWVPYGMPVLRALERLGISMGRGNWTQGRRARAEEVIVAQRHVMLRALAALEGPEIPLSDRDHLIADLRLLTVAAEARP